MKKLFTSFVLMLVLIVSAVAQPPQSFKYQAVLRDASGQVLANQEVIIAVSILQGSVSGTEVFSESHELTTNGFGLANVAIGEMEPVAFSSIDWSMGPYFVKIMVDGVEMGTSQLLSVPYALHAGSVENTDDADADPTNELQDISLAGQELTISDGSTVTLPDEVDDADADPTNELQDITLSGQDLTISDGSTVTLPDEVEDADADPTNELNSQVALNGTDLEVTDAGGTITTDLSSLVDDADADPMNEIQDISLTGQDLTISDGSTVTLPDEVDDADADPTNEIQDITLSGQDLTISDGSTVTLPDEVDDADADPTNELNSQVALNGTDLEVTDAGGTITTDLSSLVDDADADPMNEIQDITLSGQDLTISDGSTVTLPDEVDDADADPTNEIQDITLSGQDLTISDGSTVTLPDEVDDADADPTNELNSQVALNGTDLEITDAGGTITTDLSSLVDDADADPTNELQDISLIGTDLSITDGSTVDLSILQDGTGTDDQRLGWLVNKNGEIKLGIENANSVDLNFVKNGTGWNEWEDNEDYLAKWAARGSLVKGTMYDNGNIGIGTDSPGAKLEVAGQVKITGGLPGAGKILTSDESGLATWENAIGNWSKINNDIYYSLGKVGIGISNPADIGSASLNVEGGIQYRGGSSVTTPGLLYYDPTPPGTFKYIDNSNITHVLGTGTINYNGTLWTSSNGDLRSYNDVIANSSLAVGNDAVAGEIFGFATVLLKENNLRIKFEDTSNSASFPTNDWQLTANESVNGGQNYFAIEDITGGTIPFKVRDGAPNNSLYVATGGNVGIGTDSPARSLHINDVLRLEPTTEPASPAAGDIYFDSTSNKLRCYDGTVWNDLW